MRPFKRTLLLFVIIPASAAALAYAEGHGGHGSDPLKEEMAILDRAFREIVSSVAQLDPEGVISALKPLKGTMERTHEALHSGVVHLGKGSGKEKQFVEMDRKFHHGLEELEDAAKRGDIEEMTGLTKSLLEGCVACHSTFKD